MSRNQKEINTFQSSPSEKNVKIGTIIIAVALLIIFSGLLFWMYSVRLIVLPESLSRFLGIGQARTEDESSDLADGLDGAVRNHAPNELVEIVFEVDLKTLLQAFLDEPTPEGVYIEANFAYHETNSGILSTQKACEQAEPEVENQKVENFTLTQEAVVGTKAKLVRDGNRFRAEIYDENNRVKKRMIGDETTVFFDDLVTGDSRSLPRSKDFSPENEIGLPSVDALFEVLSHFSDEIFSDSANSEVTDFESSKENSAHDSDFLEDNILQNGNNLETSIADPTDARYANLELLFLKSGFGNVYYVAFDDLFLSTHEEYFVSLEGRIILRQRVSRDNVVIFDFSAEKYSLDEKDFRDEKLYAIN